MGKPSVAYRSCKLDSASNIEPQTDKMKVLESGGGKTVYFKYFIFQLSEFRLECFHSQTDQISFAQNEKKKFVSLSHRPRALFCVSLMKLTCRSSKGKSKENQ